jgi:hypothetical protein
VSEDRYWEAGVALTGPHAGCAYVESSDFTHDARLYVYGDFETAERKLAYAQEIARRLNASNLKRLNVRAERPGTAGEKV